MHKSNTNRVIKMFEKMDSWEAKWLINYLINVSLPKIEANVSARVQAQLDKENKAEIFEDKNQNEAATH